MRGRNRDARIWRMAASSSKPGGSECAIRIRRARPSVSRVKAISMRPQGASRSRLTKRELNSGAVISVNGLTMPAEPVGEHSHAGPTIGYVTAGEIENQVLPDPPALFKPGGHFYEAPRQVHKMMRNRSADAAKLLIFHAGRTGVPASLLKPAIVTDRSDPKLVHLDGLNLSRAWCMRSIAAALPTNDPARKALSASAHQHATAALAHVASGDYAGEHWLASFAVFLLSN